MPALQIIGAPQSNFVWVTRIVAAEKGVEIELLPRPPHSPDVYAVHPFGKIPGMRHGEVTLAETRAICFYIDRAFPGPSLVPADIVAAAKVEQWASLITDSVDHLCMRQYALAYVFPGTPDGSPDRARIDSAVPLMTAALGVLAKGVAATGHLVGEGFTLADAYALPILHYMSHLPESAGVIAENAALDAYLARHKERASFKATIPPPLTR